MRFESTCQPTDCALTAVIEFVNVVAKLMHNKEQSMTVNILLAVNPCPLPLALEGVVWF